MRELTATKVLILRRPRRGAPKARGGTDRGTHQSMVPPRVTPPTRPPPPPPPTNPPPPPPPRPPTNPPPPPPPPPLQRRALVHIALVGDLAGVDGRRFGQDGHAGHTS